ncbi:uncharacterized protein ATNIH1004_011125 [Aspergillus tanneri]|uniref:Uncharacterized protein n=1 Tax=Aspergillus tanneri TaxID=1220188 RepID=A0A5M9MA64_9EURO|nr:uncharacterized protein ATNIH1004_011125 [Aspergillus tanneri]KAA8642184.1 hypothetical protein ATNIH1004_011125 [Aspergillus tanneri]
MPEIQAQIDSLRLAFSADINHPFDLKPTFPYGSPSETYHPSPPLDSHYNPRLNYCAGGLQNRVGYTANPMTPISGSVEDSKSNNSAIHQLGIIPSHSSSCLSIDVPLVDENSWDPTRIINQWNMAFSIGPSSINTSSPLMGMHNNSTQGIQNSLGGQYPVQYGQPAKIPSVAPTQSISHPQFSGQQIVFTARDWQQSVASVFDPTGLKRQWNYAIDLETEHNPKRQR